MDQRTPPTVGVVVSLSVVVAVVVPYVALSSAAAAAIPTYYGQGLVGPWGPALLALVSAVAFASGRQNRTPPDTVAGATLALGVATALLAVEWALAVDPAVVQSIGTEDWLGSHRWVVVLASLLPPAVAVWYARTLDLL
jgi:hypothetical protein